jgi:hypothetical protein
MHCYAPLAAWRRKTCNASGKRGLAFSVSAGDPLMPLYVPCGQCIGCRLEYSRQWAVRCMHERQMHAQSCFVTLTYAPEHLPPGGTLVKRDVQLFLKKLRQAVLPGRIRFFLCGEYGEKRDRPHYHALLFGMDFADKVLAYTSEAGYKCFVSKELDRLWGLGRTETGSVSFESAAYVARYCVKKVRGEEAAGYYQAIDETTGEIVDRAPEFVLMSLKPGIGASWLKKYWRDVFPMGEVVSRGVICNSPRYYDKHFELVDAAGYRKMQVARQRRGELHFEDSSPRRLRDAEAVKRAQLGFLRRRLEET